MVTAVLLALAAPAAAEETTPLPDARNRPDRILFADIPWGTPVDSLAERLAAHGYVETRGARNPDRLAASGRLFDRFATVHALLDDQGRLARWEITLPSKGERNEYQLQRKIYDDAVVEMTSRYGRRREAVDRFRFPYAKGDGDEARGVRQGYVTVRSSWTSRGGDRLILALDRDMSVAFTYESRYWRKIEDERRRRKAKDL